MKTAYGNAPMKFIRLEAVAQVMNWTTGFKRSVNCWPNRSTPLAPGNGRQQPATEATPALRGRLRRRTMNAASYNRAEHSKSKRCCLAKPQNSWCPNAQLDLAEVRFL